MTLSIFSYVYRPSVCPLWDVSIQTLCPFFNWAFVYFWCWVLQVLYKFWILTPYQMYGWICAAIQWVVFLFCWCFPLPYKNFLVQAAHMSISRWVDKTIMGHLHNEMLLGHKKRNFTLCNSLDGPGEHYVNWNKPVRERQLPYDFTHMENLMNKLNQQRKWGQTHTQRAGWLLRGGGKC